MSAGAIFETGRTSRAKIDPEALYEIVNGQRVELPPMSILASVLSSRLYLRVAGFLEGKRRGIAVCEALFILDPEIDLRRRPDVAFVSTDRWPFDMPIPETGDWRVIPDLTVEVISPNDIFEDVFDKIEEYFKYGVRRVWVVMPREAKILVFAAPDEFRIVPSTENLEDPELLPGFRLPLAELFKNPPATANA